MKKFLQKILIGMLFFAFPLQVLACSVTPDIIHEFKINTQNNPVTIEYSLQTWDNLRPKVIEILQKNNGNISQNFEKILKNTIIADSDIKIEWVNLGLNFLTGSLVNEEAEAGNYLPTAILRATYVTDISLEEVNRAKFSMDFNKKTLDSISPLIHPYLTTDIQQNAIPKGYLLDEKGDFFDWYEGDFVIQAKNSEDADINHFSLEFFKNSENFINPNGEISRKNTANIATKNTNNTGKIDIFKPLDTLKNFFEKNNSLLIQAFGIILAIISGMAHGLLPWHSKSLLLAYVSSNGNISKKNIFTIIASVTFSHTAFIFILAIIIIILQKWTGASTLIAQNFSAILYAIFGIFFVFLGIKSLKNSQKTLLWNNGLHPNNCLCCSPKSLKSTISMGFLAGLNPCVDALILFVFALSIGNVIFAIIAILAFSLWIGITLGIIASTLAKGKAFLAKKWKQFAEKFSHFLTIGTGIFLIIMGIFHFL